MLERHARDVDEEDDSKKIREEKSISILLLREALAQVTKNINSDEPIASQEIHHTLREDLAKEMIKRGCRQTDRSMKIDLNLAHAQQDLSTLNESNGTILKQIGDIVSDPKRARRDDLRKLLRPWTLPKHRRTLLAMMQEHDIALRASRKRTKNDPWWRVRGVDSKEYDLRHHRTTISQDMKRLCDVADRILFSKSIDKENEDDEEEEDSMWWITHCSPSLAKTLYSKISKSNNVLNEEEYFWSDVSTTARDLVSRMKQSHENTQQIYADLLAEKEYRTKHQEAAARKLQQFFRRANISSSLSANDTKDESENSSSSSDTKKKKGEDSMAAATTTTEKENNEEEDIPMDVYERLVQLAALRERDLLTEKEFKAAKCVVLASANKMR